MYMDITDRDRVWNYYIGADVEEAKDGYGAIIKKDATCNSRYAWEVDHIIPASVLKKIGVDDDLIDDSINLRIINKSNNRSKGDSFPEHNYDMVSRGSENVNIEPLTMTFKDQKIKELKEFYRDYFEAFIRESAIKERISAKRRHALNVLRDMGYPIVF